MVNKIEGTNDSEVKNGTLQDDNILLLAGNDISYGLSGRDNIDGGVGNDVLLGGYYYPYNYDESDIDTLTGGIGQDALYGGAGTDFLYGGDNDDALSGGGFGVGNDNLGSDEYDELAGGSGNDVFILGAFFDEIEGNFYRGEGFAQIRDFQDGDKIYLAASSDDISIPRYGGTTDVFATEYIVYNYLDSGDDGPDRAEIFHVGDRIATIDNVNLDYGDFLYV